MSCRKGVNEKRRGTLGCHPRWQLEGEGVGLQIEEDATDCVDGDELNGADRIWQQRSSWERDCFRRPRGPVEAIASADRSRRALRAEILSYSRAPWLIAEFLEGSTIRTEMATTTGCVPQEDFLRGTWFCWNCPSPPAAKPLISRLAAQGRRAPAVNRVSSIWLMQSGQAGRKDWERIRVDCSRRR